MKQGTQGHFAKSRNPAFWAIFFSKGQFLDSMTLTQKSGLSPKLDSRLGTIGNITKIGFPISRCWENWIPNREYRQNRISNSKSDWEIGIIANSNWEIGIIANSDREYRKPDFPISGNRVSDRDSSGVSPKSGFQSGPIRSDGISLKTLTRKSAKMPNPEILRSVPVI